MAKTIWTPARFLTAEPVAAGVVVAADGVGVADALASVEVDSTVVDLEEVEDLVVTAVVVVPEEVTGAELTEVVAEVTLPGTGAPEDGVAPGVDTSAVLGTGTLLVTPGVMVATETREYGVPLR